MESRHQQLSRSCADDRDWGVLVLQDGLGAIVIVQGTLGACISISSLWFLPQALPDHWIRDMQPGTVCVSHTLSEGIPGIYWRRKVGHH